MANSNNAKNFLDRIGRAECIHDDQKLYVCNYCDESICKKCLDKSHNENCAFKESVKIIQNEPLGFTYIDEVRTPVFFLTGEGTLVKTYRRKKLKSGEVKIYGPYYERHSYDSETKSSFFVKYIGKIFTEI